jgi:hypothetical protein
MCDSPDLTAHYSDPFDARIASMAMQLDALMGDARQQGRRVPLTVERAAGDLWRWAERSLTPRGRAIHIARIAGEVPLWP